MDEIEDRIEAIAERGICPFVLGGDHSITYPNVKGWAEANGYENVGLIHIDAHADTGDGEGFEYDHATFVTNLVESGLVDGENYTLIGSRGFWPPDAYEDMREAGMNWYTASEVAQQETTAIAAEAVERAQDGTDAVWLSFDVDALDPAYAPGTGTPVTGGLTSREAFALVRTMATEFDADSFGFDVVEVAPQLDTSTSELNGGITANFANRLCLEVMGGLALSEMGLDSGSPIKPADRDENPS
ncbi:agmatinase family protein [Natronococcus occultus]|uniref:agmatinase family protein n=1 Tax=Natronococcus occultus TaxID=29288 RepID=UPI002480F153|nr:agmatinase family protein [Natronococcus occultus]